MLCSASTTVKYCTVCAIIMWWGVTDVRVCERVFVPAGNTNSSNSGARSRQPRAVCLPHSNTVLAAVDFTYSMQEQHGGVRSSREASKCDAACTHAGARAIGFQYGI